MGSSPRLAAWRVGVVLAGVLAAALVARESAAAGWSKEEAPIPAPTLALMAARNTAASAPILIRAYKKEAELEVWKKARDGRFVHLKTYPICRWSGQLGPKRRQGDRQTPEGFYAVGPQQMNPNSSYHLSFNIGFPNAYDRAHGGSGAHLMVHGTCSSAGCFAMTDQGVEEIYALAREAFRGGQAAFQFQSYPFRMTAENLAKHRSDPNLAFWRQLKEGSDRFEATAEEPAVGVANGRYAFGPSRTPEKEALAQKRRADEDARVARLIEDGIAGVRTTYADGGQHSSFRALARAGAPSLGMVSRPEALALAGREIVVVPARPKRPVQVAEAKAAAPAVEATASIAAGAGPAAEPSVFAPMPLGPTWRTAAKATLAGSAPILPPALTPRTIEVAARW
jgi:murein L,D-transpeptidase YafK